MVGRAQGRKSSSHGSPDVVELECDTRMRGDSPHAPLNGAHRSHARTRAGKDVRLPPGRRLQAFKHGDRSGRKGDRVRVPILRPLGCDRPEAGRKVDLREGQPEDLADARPGIEAEPNRIADPILRLESGPDGPDLIGGEGALSWPLLGRLLEPYAWT